MSDSINKAKAQAIGSAVEKALAAVAEEFGLTVEVRGGKFSPTSYAPRVEFATAGAAEDDFRTYAHMYGLEPNAFGAIFTSKGRTFRLSGLAHRSRTYPILATEVKTGKTYKFTTDGIRAILSRESGHIHLVTNEAI